MLLNGMSPVRIGRADTETIKDFSWDEGEGDISYIAGDVCMGILVQKSVTQSHTACSGSTGPFRLQM